MNAMRGNDDERLDALFRAYRDACPTPEASANFMPALWGRIEAKQRLTFSFRHMANGFVTAAVALTIALGVYMYVPHASATTSGETYIEALAEANPLETPDIVGPVKLELNPNR
jgi:hypothetical protein